MSTSTKILQELLPFLDKYSESKREKTDLKDFLTWMRGEVPLSLNRQAEPDHWQRETDDQIAAHIYRLARFARNYYKIALKGSELSNVDEFIVLVSLLEKDNTKSGVIQHTLLDFNTGISIIRRMVKKEYLHEYEDPEDKRSKRVGLTQKGQLLLQGMFERLGIVGGLVTADLSEEEKLSTLGIVQHLDRFHISNFRKNSEVIENHLQKKSDTQP